MNSTPDVTIVMISWSPTPYRLKVLGQSLGSLRAHTQRPYRLIVVDNGPEQQTCKIREFEPDIHLINHVNKNVGPSRNQGAALVDTEFVVFADNDIGYFPGWLNATIGALKKYSQRKLIASVVKNAPMMLSKYVIGPLDDYVLYRRCAGMSMVMRMSTYHELGGFSKKRTNVGHWFCHIARKRRYAFIHHPEWTGRHLAKSSYHYKRQQFIPETGKWISKTQESKL
jgi:glycosyltransferase involved in cell wall biosynthesis